MRNGHKGRMACRILELMLGVGLILYICLADRQGSVWLRWPRWW